MTTVAIGNIKEAEYPRNKNFPPAETYPEYPLAGNVKGKRNYVYAGVRDVLHLLGLDAERFDTKDWNPLRELIKPGNTVLIKPNMVRESHLDKPDEFEYVITHGAVIRAVCDYVIIALKGKGKILFADSPETDAKFGLICQRNGLTKLVEFYRQHALGIEFKILDLRIEHWLKKDGVIVKRWPLLGDPKGYTVVKLNSNSEFIGHQSCHDYFGATFDKGETKRHHNGKVHEYLISSSVLSADVLINVPKLKTHKKSGLTCCLKNMVGINGDKNWLPHHTEGTPCMGGDQYPCDNYKAKLEYKIFGWFKAKAQKNRSIAQMLGRLKKVGRTFFGSTEQVIRSGNWYGNDTVWRMILDLNKAVFHFDNNGELRSEPRRMFCLVDGILAGEGIGPLHPDCKGAGLLIGGVNPAMVDRVCAQIMGYDYLKIPSVKNAFEIKRLPFAGNEPDAVVVSSNVDRLNGKISEITFDPEWAFVPHFGWKGHIELSSSGIQF